MRDGHSGKKILITGASNGIGREIALLFAAEGCDLIITYCNDKAAGENVSLEIKKLGGTSRLLHLDLESDESIHALTAEVKAVWGTIDILINNAAISRYRPFEELNESDIQQILRINLEGTIKLTHGLITSLTEQLINIGSRSGLAGYENLVPYCASKWGLRGFSQALAVEYPHLEVTVVNPEATATQMRNFTGANPKKVAEIVKLICVGEIGHVSGEDINMKDFE